MKSDISFWRAWVLAARPKTLPAAVAPVLLGQFLAWQVSEQFSFLLVAVIFCCAISLQVAVNLANDVFDFDSGVDAGERLGPARAAQSGWLTPRQLKDGLTLVLGIAVISGLYLIWVGGWWYLLLGGLSILAALGYSAGPFPLASNALGELAVFLFFGLLAVAGSFSLHHADITIVIWIYGGALGFLSAAIMLVNNIRDRETDKLAGKNTLAVRLGADVSRQLYGVLLLLPCAWQISQGVSGWLLSVIALWLWGCMYTRDGRQLNVQLAQTAMFCLFYSLVVVADQW